MPWNNGSTLKFSPPPKTPRNFRKFALGKIRTKWSKRNHRFNPIKTNRYNTMNTKMMDMNKIDIIKTTPRKACECFSLTCSYCRQDTPHPSPIHSDWSSEDWDGDKVKAKLQKSLISFEAPKQKTNTEHIMDIDEVPFHKLNLEQDEQKEKEPLEVTQSLVLLPSDPINVEATAKDKTEEEDDRQPWKSDFKKTWR